MKIKLLLLITLTFFMNSYAQIEFEDHVIDISSDFKDIHTADIDGDGDMDVLSASRNDDKIAWYENLDGLGTFGSQQIISTNADYASSVFTGDLDGDGDIDVLSASAQDDKIAWYENLDGLGTFGSQQIISTNTDYATSVYSADIDGDGDLDVLSASGLGNKIVWYENLDGLGGFGSQQIIEINAYGALNVYGIDIDNDDDIDVFYTSYVDNKIAWYENLDGLGSFGTQQVIGINTNGARSIYATDINGDGYLDIITSCEDDPKVSWYENTDGQGAFGNEQIITTSVFGMSYAYSSDVDGDGDMDVLSASRNNGKIAWYENVNGLGTFGQQQIIANNPIGALDVFASDIDGDGDLDVLSAFGLGNKIVWYENLGFLNNHIIGNVNFDIDSNGCNGNNFGISNIMVTTDNGLNSFSTFTSNNGNYILNTNEGDFTTTITSELPNYFVSNPTFYTSNFIGLGNTDIADFCIEPIGDINDLNVSVYPLNDARPGFEATYQIVYRNVGTTIITDALELTFDDTKISFLEASEGPIMQSSNSLTFDFYSLLPFETKTINVVFEVFTPPTTEIGDILPFTAVISPVTGDYTEDDNTFNFDQTVIGAYDPNDIQVMEGDEIYESETDNYLHYIIRFQNVGTASAINVRVTNLLDSNLDWNTLQIENISHTNRVEIRDGNQVEFIFENINLPDSTSNEEGSHGYIQYKIKPKNTVGLGDSMSNNADIYFDFNPPVLTNIVTTTVVENLSVNENSILKTTIYPNPSDGLLQIKSNNDITKLIIYNQLGQVVLEESNENGIHSINLDNLSQGIYFIKLSDTNFNNVIKRLIKK